MNKKINTLSYIILLFCILAACGSASSETVQETEENIQAAKVIQNYDREIKVENKPTKVLTLGQNTTEIFIALELSDYVIGHSLKNHSRGPLPEYKEAYEKIPLLTYGSSTREAVLTSEADFIYGIDWEFGGEGLDVEELAKFGITTYMNRASTIEEIFQEILDIGTIFEIESVAKAYVDAQRERLDQINEKIAGQERVKVLVYDSGDSGVFTASGSNFESILIELAGGHNIFSDIQDKQWMTVSHEEILMRNPDVILIHDYDAPSVEQKMEQIKNDPALSQLQSVQEERFVTISLESVLPGGRVAYAVEKLAQGFYPELFE